MMDLAGKTAIVTGAGTGIGRELAREFARRGARVVCVGRRAAELHETKRLIDGERGTALAIAADVTQRADVERMVKATLAAFGAIELLFNNAGSFRSVTPVWEVDAELWWTDVTTNLFGSLLCCRAVLPYMRERNSGVIINMDGGGGANGPYPGGSGYGCSKVALVRLTEGIARELEADGSGVLAFCMNPGLVRSAMTEAIATGPTGQRWHTFVQQHLDRGLGYDAADCAKATMRLLAIASPELNGCTFGVATDFDAVERNKAAIRDGRLFTLRLADRLPPAAGSDLRAAKSARSES
jgi:3-oxoacyl-[acyl-carrier protein] reductase